MLVYSYKSKTEGSLNLLIVIFQAITAILCVEFSKKMKYVDYPSFDFTVAIRWAPVNVLFCLMLFTGMTSLEHNSVPMITVFKNISNITTAVGEQIFLEKKNRVVSGFGVCRNDRRCVISSYKRRIYIRSWLVLDGCKLFVHIRIPSIYETFDPDHRDL